MQNKSYCPCCGSSVDSRDVILDRSQGIIAYAGNMLRVRPQEVKILACLLRAWPQAVSTDVLIWEMYEGRDEPDSALKIVHIAISQLRAGLKSLDLKITHTSSGYKINIPRDGSVNKLSVRRAA